MGQESNLQMAQEGAEAGFGRDGVGVLEHHSATSLVRRRSLHGDEDHVMNDEKAGHADKQQS